MMLQRINDQDLELHACMAQYRISIDGGSLMDRVWLDLRDARAEINDQVARIERLERRNANLIANCNTHNEHLKIAVDALKFYAMRAQDNTIARTALDRIKGITDANK